MEEVNLVIKP